MTSLRSNCIIQNEKCKMAMRDEPLAHTSKWEAR